MTSSSPETIAPESSVQQLVADSFARANKRRQTPGSTYRFQFRKEFTLADATKLIPYLHALGITHVYASPLLKARPGSPHGYDVVDPGILNPELGTESDFDALVSELRARGMGLILDTVPNHMCISGENPWWSDVLEHGPSSPHAESFDIAWYDSPRPGMDGRLLLPVLGEPYGQALEGGQLSVVFDAAGFGVKCYESRLPVDPRTYGMILGPAVERLKGELGAEHSAVTELQSILNETKHLPPRSETDRERIAECRVEAAVVKRRLVELDARFPEAARAVRATVSHLPGTPADAEGVAHLDDLLEAQAYRVCFWRVASDEINYRRFFDVNELAAVSTEREEVFRAIHRKLFAWLAAGQADGLRIDHPDGLYDPKQYLDRVQSHYLLAIAHALIEENPDKYSDIDWERDRVALLERFDEGARTGQDPEGELPSAPRPLYVVVEKILGDNEKLRPDWACDGTTGYEFVAAVNGLFIDAASDRPLSEGYRQFTDTTGTFAEMAYEKKSLILSSSLSSELTSLSFQLDRLARIDRRSRDFTLNGLRRALREVIAAFPVYRSYVNGGVHETDRTLILKAVRRGRARNPLLAKPLFDFIRDTLLQKDAPSSPATDEYRSAQKRFAGKFQQLTSPVTAKGIEDTAFYVYNRLISLNEVGGEPGRWGWSPEKVHKFFADRAVRSPGGMSPLSTHDTKRSEDARARLNVLSEMPHDWLTCVRKWSDLNRRFAAGIEDEADAPDTNEEYLIYQTIVAIWPTEGFGEGGRDAFNARIQAFVKKALCEAKVHSSWINPNPDYEAAVAGFLEKILDPTQSGEFLTHLGTFVERVAKFGCINALAQTLIRCTAPGVPDTYQGTENWDFSLVDPDNRRPVDYGARSNQLSALEGRMDSSESRLILAMELAADMDDPRVKLFVIARALGCRRKYSEAFNGGEYHPVQVTGAKSAHVFAYIRGSSACSVLVVVPRLPTALVPPGENPTRGSQLWEDTKLILPPDLSGVWENYLTGEQVNVDGTLLVGEALKSFPVCLMVRGQA